MRVKRIYEGLGDPDPMPVPEFILNGQIRPTYTDGEIVKALAEHGGNLTDTANALGMGHHYIGKVARRCGVYDKAKQRTQGGSRVRKRCNIDLDEVVHRRAQGETMCSIARSYGCGEALIHKCGKAAGRNISAEVAALKERIS